MTPPRNRTTPAVRRFPIRDEEQLKEVALRYLGRFPCTAKRLRTHLVAKMRDAVAAGEASASAAPGWVEGVVRRLIEVRLVDDDRYAEARAHALHGRGRSTRYIRRDLEQRGAPSEAAAKAIGDLVAETPDADLIAAVRLAEKRRLGPFGKSETRREHRARHLATLARAGFGFGLARSVIDARDADAARALVRGDAD